MLYKVTLWNCCLCNQGKSENLELHTNLKTDSDFARDFASETVTGSKNKKVAQKDRKGRSLEKDLCRHTVFTTKAAFLLAVIQRPQVGIFSSPTRTTCLSGRKNKLLYSCFDTVNSGLIFTKARPAKIHFIFLHFAE